MSERVVNQRELTAGRQGVVRGPMDKAMADDLQRISFRHPMELEFGDFKVATVEGPGDSPAEDLIKCMNEMKAFLLDLSNEIDKTVGLKYRPPINPETTAISVVLPWPLVQRLRKLMVELLS